MLKLIKRLCVGFLVLVALHAWPASNAAQKPLTEQQKAYFELINLYQRADVRTFCHENTEAAYPVMYGDKALMISCKTRREWFAMWGRVDDGSNSKSIATR